MGRRHPCQLRPLADRLPDSAYIFSDSTHPFMTGSKCGRAYSLGSNQCSAIGIFTSMTQIVDRWSGVTVNTN